MAMRLQKIVMYPLSQRRGQIANDRTCTQAGMCDRATADRVRDRLNQSLSAIGFVEGGGDGARSTWGLGYRSSTRGKPLST